MKNIILLFAIFTLFSLKGQEQKVTDIDGNIYNTVTIGTQVWTQENLKVTHFRNGDPIPNIEDDVQWYNLTSGAYCNYDNDLNNAVVYGRLYNWYAVNDVRNITPIGWHVPTYSDLELLQIYLDYDLVAGGKLKETGTSHWMSPNTGATNESEFTALPGGQRTDSVNLGVFSELTMQGYWWSSSEMDKTYPWGINISYNSEGMTNWAASKKEAGFSIRLIKDSSLGIYNSNKNEFFNVYPNPAHDKIIIAYGNNSKSKMSIYNLFGELLMSQEFNERINNVDISTLASGVYIVKLTTDNWSVQQKFVKE